MQLKLPLRLRRREHPSRPEKFTGRPFYLPAMAWRALPVALALVALGFVAQSTYYLHHRQVGRVQSTTRSAQPVTVA